MLRKTLVLVIAALAIASSAWAYTLIDEFNAPEVPRYTLWYATQVALSYAPSETYTLGRIEFYTTGVKDDVTIALRPDDAGTISTTILTSGTYDSTNGWSWQGADLTPYAVVAGSKYWVTWYNTYRLGTSLANSAETHSYRWGHGTGIDYYPTEYDLLGFKARFYGEDPSTPTPEPASLSLLGLGLLGLAGLRRKRR